jgi:hypothetical protein
MINEKYSTLFYSSSSDSVIQQHEGRMKQHIICLIIARSHDHVRTSLVHYHTAISHSITEIGTYERKSENKFLYLSLDDWR